MKLTTIPRWWRTFARAWTTMFVGFMRSGALGEAIERQNTSDEGIIMPSSSWMISATNPG